MRDTSRQINGTDALPQRPSSCGSQPELFAKTLVEELRRNQFPEAAEKLGLPPHWVARTRRASRECLQDSRSCSERVLAACVVFTRGFKHAVAHALIDLPEPHVHVAAL